MFACGRCCESSNQEEVFIVDSHAMEPYPEQVLPEETKQQELSVLPEPESIAPLPIPMPAEDEAKGLADTFMITLNKGPGEKIGLDVDWASMDKLKITQIKEGLINSWNLANPSQCVQAGDSIVKINSVSGDAKKLLAAFKIKASLSVQIERAPVGSHGGSKSQTQKTKGGVKGGVKEEVTQRKANPEEAAQWKANPKAKSRLKSGPPKVTVEMAWQVIRDTKPILEKPENLSRLKREIENCKNDDELNEMMNMGERLLPLVWGMVGRIFKKHGFKDDRQMFGALLQFKDLAKKDDPLKAEVEIVMHMLGQKM